MRQLNVRICFVFLLVHCPLSFLSAFGAETFAAQPLDPAETAGEPPYEMVRAGRTPVRPPTVGFDSLDGWTVECQNGAKAQLMNSKRQRLWDSPVARLVYRGTSDESTVTIQPPEPLSLPGDASAVTVWMYGNNWSWVADPTTPQVTIELLLKNKEWKTESLEITRVRWKEWWLVHKVLPAELKERAPLRLAGIRVKGAANKEDRELYFENLTFFNEELKTLSFEARPQRGIDLLPGQPAGPNTGPGRLPFPTRPETILPENRESNYTTQLLHTENGKRFRFLYKARDAVIEYCLQPGENYWGPVIVKINRTPVADVLVDAGPVFTEELTDLHLVRSSQDGEVARAEWQGSLDGETVLIQSAMRMWQKSLVVDFICKSGKATELSYGHFRGVEDPELIQLPFMNYGGHHLNVLMSRGVRPFFASVWMDWYLSNSSEPYTIDEMEGEKVRLNGGVRYLPKTDGTRNDLFERFFVTLSPLFEETLATIDNPPAKEGKIAGSRLWQETWGPQDFEKEHQRSKLLRAHGIEMLTQCNHEIAWRDGGESFTFRLMAAPGKGGDEALKEYVAKQKSLGWRSGLYTNYTDYAPVNSYWDIDMVMRKSSGDLITAWPRCYSPKALFAVEMDRKLAPQVQKKYQSDAAYTDVHTAVSPWSRTDYDARVPGAGTFAATFYPYGELLLHDQEVYKHHCWSEGHHQWLYAGLTTGNYGLTYSGLRLWEYPYLPHFELLKIHPLSVDIGVPWTAHFFREKDGWNDPENIESSIDQFLAATIAFGRMAWLVEEAHGIRQTCRSYYMMQQLQSRYVMEKPEEILYGTKTGLISSSEAFLKGDWKSSKLYVRYPGNLKIWVNGNPSDHWNVEVEGTEHILPPYGWLAIQGDDFFESSEIVTGRRCDRVSSSDYVFLDGRGVAREFAGVGTSGSLAVKPFGERGLLLIAVEGVDHVKLTGLDSTSRATLDVRSLIAKAAKAENLTVKAFKADGELLGQAKTTRNTSGWTILPVTGALRYEVQIVE